MASVHDFAEKDFGIGAITFSLVDQDGTAINLTSRTVRMFWRPVGSDDSPFADTMTVVSAAGGTVSRTWEEADYLPAGDIEVEVEVRDASNNVMTSSDSKTIKIRKRLRTV